MTHKTGEIVVRRVVAASQEIAFEAWTSPEHVEQWWCPTETARCTLCEIDLCIGGHYRLHMDDPGDGTKCEVKGEFREVSPPDRIVYTWNATTHQGEVENTLVTVQFKSLGEDATEIIIRHSGLPDTPIREGHNEGWRSMLASYAGYVSSTRGNERGDFQMTLEYEVPTRRLFEQFSSATGVGNWWTKHCTFEARVGGEAAFDFPDSGFYAHTKVSALEPPNLVEWHVVDAKHPEKTGFTDLRDWNGTSIRFEIAPLGDSRSRLTFTHVGLGPLECSTVCSSLWGFFLNESLREYFERGEGKPAG